MEKYLYFRTEADDIDNDDSSSSGVFPVSSLKGMHPTTDTAITLFFEPTIRVRGEGANATGNFTNNDSNLPLVDKVVLTVGTNRHKQAMRAIADKINEPLSKDNGFVVIADDVSSEYVSTDVTAAVITHNAAYVNA